MTDEYNASLDAGEEWEEIEEEIDPAEVERIVKLLDELLEQVQSETIRDSLRGACDEIASLVEWEEEEEEAEAA